MTRCNGHWYLHAYFQFEQLIDEVRLASVHNGDTAPWKHRELVRNDLWGIVANMDGPIPMSSNINKHALFAIHL